MIREIQVTKWVVDEESSRNLFDLKDKRGNFYGDYHVVTITDAIAMLEEVKRTGECTPEMWDRIAPHVVDPAYRRDYLSDV